ncbi:hypothetical protein FACS1894130_02970 [Spirochaetia bacterium]|nr:hypothetical protein FACS1894130_02970 [Spirochaetia bacterium]
MGMNVLLKYFASIGVLIGLLNTFMMYKRIKSKYPNNNSKLENNELKNFTKWYGICFTVPFLLLQIFQIMGKYKTVFYIFLLDFNNPFYILGFITMLLLWGVLLYLVIIKDRAEIIAKYYKAFGNIPADKTKIKILFGIMFLGALIILLLGNKIAGGAFSHIEEINI